MGFPQFTMIMAETFQINIYQKTWTPVSSSKGSLVARILSALDIEVEHELNITPLLQFKVPRGDESLNEIKIGRLAEWVYNGTVAFLGIITGPLDKNQSPYVHIKASGLMEILNWAESVLSAECQPTLYWRKRDAFDYQRAFHRSRDRDLCRRMACDSRDSGTAGVGDIILSPTRNVHREGTVRWQPDAQRLEPSAI